MKKKIFFGLMVLFVFVFGVNTYAQEGPAFEQMLAGLRAEISGRRAIAPMTEIIHIICNEGIPHNPPEDFIGELILREDYGGIMPRIAPRSYALGDRRQFFAAGKAQAFGHWGTLVRQSEFVNIWIFDAVPLARRPSGADLNNAINLFDGITYRMTREIAPFAGVRVTTGWSNMPVVGDVHGDGRVNVIIHEGRAGGYFWNINFTTANGNSPIAVFHMHPDSATNGAIFAHELQHLLFFMHLGVYAMGNPELQQDLLWFNESLSELAMVYWTQPGAKLIENSRTFFSMENSYANPFDDRIGDFINFNNSFKSYSMSRLHAKYMHSITHGQYIINAYRFILENFPTAANIWQFWENYDWIREFTMAELIGDIFYDVGLSFPFYYRGELVRLAGERLFQLWYFLFMENFAADGGNVTWQPPNMYNRTHPFISNPLSAFNFWGIRPNLGIPIANPGLQNGVFFDPDTFSANNLGARAAFDTLNSGGTVNLSGFNGTPPLGATHERFYRLVGESAENSVLTISVNDNSPYTMFYIAVPNDAPGAVSNIHNMHLGQNGATVHILSRNNIINKIDTGGQVAYLFVVTLHRNVNATITYSWGNYIPSIFPVTIYEYAEHYFGSSYSAPGSIVNIFAGIRPGYRFSHWVSSQPLQGLTHYAETSFAMPASPVTLAANWVSRGAPNPGDVNGSGYINRYDFYLLKQFLLSHDPIAFQAKNPDFCIVNANLYGGEIINSADLTLLRLRLTLPSLMCGLDDEAAALLSREEQSLSPAH